MVSITSIISSLGVLCYWLRSQTERHLSSRGKSERQITELTIGFKEVIKRASKKERYTQHGIFNLLVCCKFTFQTFKYVKTINILLINVSVTYFSGQNMHVPSPSLKAQASTNGISKDTGEQFFWPSGSSPKDKRRQSDRTQFSNTFLNLDKLSYSIFKKE